LPEDKIVVERAKQGDLAAFRQIVDRYKVTIYRIAYDMTGNRHDAEDLCQEVFLKAHRSLSQFRGDAKLSTWLHRIAINACYDHRSRKSFSTMKPHADFDDNGQVPVMFQEHALHNPERSAESSITQMHIEKALNNLSPRERSVFVLRHYNDMPLKEIAETLRISEGAVKSMLFRALKRLQKELAFYRQDLGLEKAR
jgi:RNA polymerase sigma-70 factor (ECF subfamily)